MKLHYVPGASSLFPHIVLVEAGRVQLLGRQTSISPRIAACWRFASASARVPLCRR